MAAWSQSEGDRGRLDRRAPSSIVAKVAKLMACSAHALMTQEYMCGDMGNPAPLMMK